MKRVFLLFLVVFIYGSVFSQSPNCGGMTMICLDNQVTFPLYGDGTGSGQGPQAEAGPNYNCLMTTPSPTWFYFRVNTYGSFTIHITNDMSQDIDFVCWGPFSDPGNLCSNLNSSLDCSYSTAAVEDCDIPNASPGNYYVLMITNYANNPAVATITEIGNSHNLDCGNAMITANNSLCENDTLKLSANFPNPNYTYFWSGPCGFYSTGQNAFVPNISTACEGYYKLTTIYGGQIIFTDSINIYINEYPDVTITSNTPDTVCYGADIYLMPHGASNYAWLGFPNLTNSLQTSATVTQQYTVVGSNGNCKDSVSKMIYVKGNPLDINPGDTTVCFQNPFVLQVSGGYNYQWYPYDQLSDSVGSQVTMTPVLPVNINVIYFDTVSDCEVHADININIDHPIGDIQSLTGPDSVCPGTNYTYILNPNTLAGNFKWYLLNGDSVVTNIRQLSYNINFGENSGLLRVRSFNSCSSTDTSSKFIFVRSFTPQPSVGILGDTNICLGDTTFLSTLLTYDHYFWSNGDSLQSISVFEDGNYFVRVRNNNLCRSPESDTITIDVIPLSPTFIVLQGNHIHSLVPHGNNWCLNGVFTGDTTTDLYYTQNGNYYSVLKINDCRSTPSNTINISGMDINEFNNENNSFDIYPNPATDKITIEFTSKVEKSLISLYSSDGKLLINMTVEDLPIQEMSIESLASGIYYLIIKSEINISNFKVIKL